MASGALFGSASASRSQSKNLVEFRAGKMYMKGKMVHPDKRKGLVYVYQSEGDSLMHFCWKERTKATPDEDLIIFPDDVEFKRVSQCTTGRVYLLKFKSSSRKMFFWMQEPKSDKDEENGKKVNDFLNNPPAPGSSRAGGSSGGGLGLPPELAGLGGEGDLQNILGNMSQQQLMQLLGGMGMGNLGGLSSLFGGRPSSSQSDSQPPSRVQSSPGPRTTTAEPPSSQPRPVTAAALSPPAATAGEATASSQPAATAGSAGATAGDGQTNIQLRDLQNILSGMGAGGSSAEPKESIDLAAAVTPEVMIPILANAEVQERLIPFLPEGESLPKTEGELRNTVQSPQFQQAMQSFSAALASGQLGPLMNQFNLGDDVVTAAAAGDVEAFAKAMQSAVKTEEKMETEDSGTKEKKEVKEEKEKDEEEK